MNKTILVTGGTGFIGSHACVALLEASFEPIVLDNLCNSEASVIGRIGQICGREPGFVEGDIRDARLLDDLFKNHQVSAVMHFAGLKAVGESVSEPERYHDNNVVGTSVLLAAMQNAGVKTIVFSSSATVYGDPDSVPITEDAPLRATNPYGETKLAIENMLADIHIADSNWRIACLRYFNPVGAHPSGLIGEKPSGVPENLVPFITQAAAGLRGDLKVFGNDYDTIDGTGVRDYIHVMDLVEGHLAALDYLEREGGILTVNLGTGHGISVLEMIEAFESTNDCKVPYRIAPRRPGDIARCWADVTLAGNMLGWRSERTLEDMCRDAWRWQMRQA
jgi:UDP-glucose 4-epimerase